ncbi:MAG: Holliday junction branch migration protein RuvA [Tissierellia bacterium]|nr:Holliday junction branch migration protein RuvA [Tissierellia bacterium]
MYDYITGKIVDTGLNYVVIENNGIGYRVNISANSIHNLETQEDGNSKVYTELIIRDDSHQLYGFSNVEERQVYNLLTTVSGVGPKVAIGILSGLSYPSIVSAVLSDDAKTLTSAPGVGKKTSERIVLELKDKFEKLDIDLDIEVVEIVETTDEMSVAMDALNSLGYSKYEVNGVIDHLDVESLNAEDIIREVLKLLSK